jgi:hypothetical protein
MLASATGKVHKPRTIGILAGEGLSESQRKSRLADATRTHQCQQPQALEPPPYVRELLFASDEAAQRDR